MVYFRTNHTKFYKWSYKIFELIINNFKIYYSMVCHLFQNFDPKSWQLSQLVYGVLQSILPQSVDCKTLYNNWDSCQDLGLKQMAHHTYRHCIGLLYITRGTVSCTYLAFFSDSERASDSYNIY